MFKKLLVTFLVAAVCCTLTVNAVCLRQVEAGVTNTDDVAAIAAPVVTQGPTSGDDATANVESGSSSSSKGDEDYTVWEGSKSLEDEDDY